MYIYIYVDTYIYICMYIYIYINFHYDHSYCVVFMLVVWVRVFSVFGLVWQASWGRTKKWPLSLALWLRSRLTIKTR